MSRRYNSLLILVVIGLMGPFSGCGESVSVPPEERLERVEMGFASVLGYVRIRPELAGPLLSLEDMLQLPNLKPLGSAMSVGDLVLPFMDRICLLCRPGTTIHMILVDPKIYGGMFGLHFETDDKGKFVEMLEEDPRYRRIPDTDPPEFVWDEELGPMLRIAGMLDAFGIHGPALGRAPFQRVIVEETERGTLVMPSHDLKGDFLAFLEGTDNLAYWDDAALVVHLETGRLAKAFSKTIEDWNVSLSNLAAKAEKMAGGKGEKNAYIFRVGQALPALLTDAAHCLAGIRFVSKSPLGGAPELRLKAAEGCALERFLHCFRSDRLDLIDLIPEGSALQWNFDPDALGRFLEDELASLAETLRFDAPLVEENPSRIVDAASDDTGRYLAGLKPALGGGCISFVTERKETASKKEKDLPEMLRFWGPLADQAFSKGELVRTPHEEDDRVERVEVVGGEAGSRYTLFSYETATTDHFRITTIPLPPDREGLMRTILDGIDSKTDRKDVECESADLIFRIDASELSDILIPGIENVIPLTIMGIGTVEGNGLTIRFMF